MISRSLTDTKKIARRFAGRLKGERGAVVLGLTGDLGAGKTIFTKELLKALGVQGGVVSPTFVLIREYPLRKANFVKAYHADLYRLRGSELKPLALRRLAKEPGALIIIEWAERARKVLPKRTLWIRFAHGKTSRERTIDLP